jgi:hypothetical protein
MKKVQINLEYQNKFYSSQESEMSDEEIKTVKEFMEQISKGKISYLTFKNNGTHFHFSKNIIENSIISLVIT